MLRRLAGQFRVEARSTCERQGGPDGAQPKASAQELRFLGTAAWFAEEPQCWCGRHVDYGWNVSPRDRGGFVHL